ncbi:MAG: DNA methyltransferase [Promethearchaeota archaeon]
MEKRKEGNLFGKKFLKKEILFSEITLSIIKQFIQYLENNKIDYEIIEKNDKENLLLLKILTINPKYLIIIIKEKNNKSYLINYNYLLKIYQHFIKKDQNSKLYIIFLERNDLNNNKNLPFNSYFVNSKDIQIEENITRKVIKLNNYISLKKNLKKGLPLGTYSERNKLNDLTGKEWIKFTKSWFIHNPPPRKKLETLHPAKFPESLIEEFILFFTKKGDFILDPFLGTGSTAVAAKNTQRNCIGIELNEKYAKISEKRISQKTIDSWIDGDKKAGSKILILNEDSNELLRIWKEKNLPKIDFCITSPPYWNQLKRNSLRQVERKELGLDTKYSENPKDIGNIDDYIQFIQAQNKIFDQVFEIIKNEKYLVIITNNIFFNGRLYPLAFDTAISLSSKWVLKDEKIWCQDDKPLLPLGINSAWVANRCHQYCLIFRKESN